MARRMTHPGLFFLLLIAALIALQAPAAAADKILQHDTDEMDGKQSSGGTGHVIAFEAPSGTWYIEAILIHGSRYGGNYNPKETFFTVAVCGDDLGELTASEKAYDLFPSGRFEWIEVKLDEPVKAPKSFKAVAAFNPTATMGVFVGWSSVKESHSGFGLPGGGERPYAADREWMMRVKLTGKKPKAVKTKETSSKAAASKSSVYRKDFDFLEKTVKRSYPALKKKNIDWDKTCKEWEGRFRECKDDETHLLNVSRLLAVLEDSHTGVTRSEVQPYVPSFENLFGGGLWIAADRGRLVLRAMMPDHHLRYEVEPGAELVDIDGRPARIVHEEVRRQVREWTGWSSDHFLDARLSVQFFRFSRDPMPALFVNPDGKTAAVKVPKWGPGGRGLSRAAVTMPDVIETEGHAVSGMLDADIGYVRILGGMNDATQSAFFEAFDALEGAKGIILDCRGMGGGGDSPAWAMAGRFYSQSTPLGTSGQLAPTGGWQFDGPLVMLQDEREISSAETFTWAMTETGRAVSVGRPTGGATIIPRTYDAPSGLFSFRMGGHDRATPIKHIQPEGIGTPPDVFVPYEPVLLEHIGDPILAAGRDIVLLLMEGADRDVVVDYYGGVLGLEPGRVKSSHKAFAGLEPPDNKKGFANVTDGATAAMAGWEIALCESKHNPMPDFAGAARRLAAIAAIAGMLGDAATAGTAAAAAEKWDDEIEAQEAYEVMTAGAFPPEGMALKSFLSRHGSTRYGKAARVAFGPGTK